MNIQIESWIFFKRQYRYLTLSVTIKLHISELWLNTFFFYSPNTFLCYIMSLLLYFLQGLNICLDCFAPKSDGYTFFSVSQERIMDEIDEEAKKLRGPKTGANWERCWDCARPALNQNRWCHWFVFSAWTGLCSVSIGGVFVDFKIWCLDLY